MFCGFASEPTSPLNNSRLLSSTNDTWRRSDKEKPLCKSLGKLQLYEPIKHIVRSYELVVGCENAGCLKARTTLHDVL